RSTTHTRPDLATIDASWRSMCPAFEASTSPRMLATPTPSRCSTSTRPIDSTIAPSPDTPAQPNVRSSIRGADVNRIHEAAHDAQAPSQFFLLRGLRLAPRAEVSHLDRGVVADDACIDLEPTIVEDVGVLDGICTGLGAGDEDVG